MATLTSTLIRAMEDNGSSVDTKHATLVAKIVAMIVLLVATIICGSIPFMLNRCFRWTERKPNSRSAAFVNFLLYLSGGVLFATTFLHLLPEVQEVVDHLSTCEEIPKLPFALPETLMCCGFFLIYLIEALIEMCLVKRAKKAKSKKNLNEATTDAEKKENAQVPYRIEGGNDDCTHGHSHAHLPVDENADNPTSLSGLLIVLALSLHEIFEGMAIGLESKTASVWIMFAAVAAHKLVLSFCLGVEIIVGRTRRILCIIYILLFSIITPIGIGIGILLSHNGVVTTSSLAAAILQGIACGTLLYVVFFELLKKHQPTFVSLLAIFLGFAIMFGLQMVDDGDDSNDVC